MNQRQESTLIKEILNAAGITEEKILQKIDEEVKKRIDEALTLKVLFIDLEQLKKLVPFERDFLEKQYFV